MDLRCGRREATSWGSLLRFISLWACVCTSKCMRTCILTYVYHVWLTNERLRSNLLPDTKSLGPWDMGFTLENRPKGFIQDSSSLKPPLKAKQKIRTETWIKQRGRKWERSHRTTLEIQGHSPKGKNGPYREALSCWHLAVVSSTGKCWPLPWWGRNYEVCQARRT